MFGLTKTQYQMILTDIPRLQQCVLKKDLSGLLGNSTDREFKFYAIQKQEAGKVRQIVNTDMRTYVFYSLIYAIFVSTTNHANQNYKKIYPLAKTRARMSWENRIMDKTDCWSMPLDQSKFDHTVEHWVTVQFTLKMLEWMQI